MKSRNRQNSFYYSSGNFGLRPGRGTVDVKHKKNYQKKNGYEVVGVQEPRLPALLGVKPLNLGDLLTDSQLQEIIKGVEHKRRSAA